MLIKFFPHGRGDGAGPVGYVTRQEGREHQPPEVLRGDPERTVELIDGIDRQWRYTSGVISFAREDAPSAAEQEQVMDEFERVAFAGLEPDQYDCLWVRHAHTEGGRIELHFVTPRMELSTGKALNIAPPGWASLYAPLRDALNYEHGWTRPDDPDRARMLQRPEEALERGRTRETIHAYVEQRVEVGDIHDRTSLVAALEDVGLSIPRQGKAYITVHDPESDARFRMKGGLYEQDWTRDQQLERAAAHEALGRSGADRGPDLERAAEARRDLDSRLEGRIRTHQENYRARDGGDESERAQSLALAALDRSDLRDPGRDLTDGALGRDLVAARGSEGVESRNRSAEEYLGRSEGSDGRHRDPSLIGRDVRDPSARNGPENDLSLRGRSSLSEDAEVRGHGETDGARTRIAALRERVGDWISAGHERVAGWLGDLRHEFERRLGGTVERARDSAELFGSALGDHRRASARHAGETERSLTDLRDAAEGLRDADREFGQSAERLQEMTRERERVRERDRGYDLGIGY